MKFKTVLFFTLFAVHFAMSQSFLRNAEDDIISKTYSQSWELDSIHKKGTFRLSSHRSTYVTPARWTSRPNEKPNSANPNNSPSDGLSYDNFEVKFQISLKTKVLQSILWGKGDLWIGYTQIAHWQLYNEPLSRPFREINYEPELIFKYPLNIRAFGGHFKALGFSFTHVSNGRELPYSRGWNRVIFDLAYERDNWIVSLRPWIRLSEGNKDDNPDIVDKIGNGEISLAYNLERHQFYAVASHPFSNLQGGNIQLNYIFPIKGHIRGHAQAFHGYGETLIDYNYIQTTVGIGISFANW